MEHAEHNDIDALVERANSERWRPARIAVDAEG